MDRQPRIIFVGRDREVRELLEGLRDAAGGRGRLILIRGEPGIGKTKLADEVASQARATGFPVLWGRALTDAGAPPYWPWIQVLRSLLRTADRDQLGPGAADMLQILPEIRTLDPNVALPADADPEAARFRLFDSVVTFLRNAAQRQPLLIVLDDLQSADAASVLLLRFLTSQLADLRVLVVCTIRDLELGPEHPLSEALVELAREPVTRTLQLRGLEESAVAAFIGATTEQQPTQAVVSAVWRATNGNPLFVTEALRLLSAEGGLVDVPGDLRITVPAGVRAVIRRRIDRLGASAAFVLLLGAVSGPEFRLEVVRRVGGDRAADAPADLEAATRAGLITAVGSAAGRYRFAHDLVRETLYDDLSPSQRSQLHRRIAEVLDELYGATASDHLPELAYHFVEAVRGNAGDDQEERDRAAARAASYARRAGEEAAVSLGYEEAARLFRLALTAIDLGGSHVDAERLDLLLALGDSQSRAGQIDDALGTFLAAADLARGLGEARKLARAALGYGGRHAWARPGNDTRLIPMLQDALALLGDDDPPLRVRLLTRLGGAWRQFIEHAGESDRLTAEAVAIARTFGDPATLNYALAGRFWATYWPDNALDRRALALEMEEIAEAAGDRERLADAHLIGFMSKSELGDVAGALREAEILRELIEELRQPAELWLGSLQLIVLTLLQGDFTAAERLIHGDRQTRYRVTPARDNVSANRLNLFLLRRAQGRVGEVEAETRASVAEFPWYPLHRAALAILLAETDRHDEARRVLGELGRHEFRALPRDNEWLLGACLAADAAHLLGDAGLADPLYRQLLPYAGRHALGHGEGSVGTVDRYLGILAATLGRYDNAARHLEHAIRGNDKMGARPWTALSQADFAEVLRRRNSPGDAARAGELEAEARATAAALGMTLFTRGPLDPTRAAHAVPPRESAPVANGVAVLRQDGEYWTVRFDGDAFSLRDARGLHHLARLLATPGRELHALDLAATGDGGVRAMGWAQDDLGSDPMTAAGPLLDEAARAAYRERMTDIHAEIAEAEAWNDPERAARAEDELDALTQQLAAAVGLGARDRQTGSPAERARVSVTRAIRSALTRIEAQSPMLAAHFAATIRTGTYCSYTPDPRAPISWDVGSTG